MKTLLAIALAAGLAGATLGLTSSAQAMPLSPIATSNGLVTQVAGGCGPGLDRGPRGGCRRNYATPPRTPARAAGISAATAAAAPTAPDGDLRPYMTIAGISRRLTFDGRVSCGSASPVKWAQFQVREGRPVPRVQVRAGVCYPAPSLKSG